MIRSIIKTQTAAETQTTIETQAGKWKNLCCLFLLLLSIFSCEAELSNSNNEVYDEGRGQLLASIKQHLVLPLLTDFKIKLDALDESITQKDLGLSQVAWQDVMLHWQWLELFQFGPAGVSGLRIAGQDLRDQIYAFPLSNPCRVEQVWATADYEADAWLSNAAINVIGLDAMEHLLFKEGSESVCPDSTRIIREGEWAQFQDDPNQVENQRWAYLASLSQGLQQGYTAIHQAWEGEFGQAFTKASTPFNSQREVIDQVFAGMFYFDEVVKDLKLGAPAGIYMTCLESQCPEQLELRSSNLSHLALANNLKALQALFKGEYLLDLRLNPEPNAAAIPVYGFDHLLEQEGAAELSEAIELHISEALSLLDNISSFEEALQDNPASITALHTKIKELCDLLKSQFVTVLNLSVPQEGAGDND